MFKALFSVSAMVNVMLLGLWFFERKEHFALISKYTNCQVELKNTQNNLIKYTQLYSDLRSKCELDKAKIEARYKVILKDVLKPIPQVHIPQTKDDCQALKEMIDEASSYFSK
jgi:hypothetical protein